MYLSGYPADTTVCLVAVEPATFDACREGYYPCPADYDRADADVDLLGLYRTAPVSAVTHVAPVRGRSVERRDELERLDADDWERILDPVGDVDEAAVFSLGFLHALETPVEAVERGVRGAWYPTFGAVRESETLPELRERMGRD